MPDTFGALLRQRRLALGLSQEALADKAGISLRGVSDLERGARRTPHPATIARLADALGLDPAGREALAAAGRPTPSAEPPGVSTSGLPLALSSFVGRERELATVRELLDTTRLLTLAGTGGIGKTRLALELARTSGIPTAFVELAPVADPQAVIQTVAATLGVGERAGLPLITQVASTIGARPMHLVLDNCEHLISACAQLSEHLLKTCDRLRIVATSREPLGLTGERVWRVPSLRLPDKDAPGEAVQLFVERAHAVSPAFTVTEENGAAVAEVCRRLDGIPLAIELAAARVRALSVHQIAERLDDRFWLLVGGNRTALARQRTLTAALDWSYQLLTPAERALLGRLAVFAGGCCLEAAEAVGAGPPVASGDVLDLMTSLVDKSLVLAETAPGSNAVRYHQLETIRQFAADRLLEAGETTATRDRLVAWVTEFVEAAQPDLVGHNQVQARQRLGQELENFVAALEWCRSQGNAQAELRLAAALGRFWHLHGPSGQGRFWLRHALAQAPAVPSAARALALNWAGRLATVNGDPDDGDLLEQSVALARELGDQRLLALALRHLSMSAQRQGDRAAASSALELALSAAHAAGDQREEAFALISLGAAAEQRGDGLAAGPLLAEGLAIARRVGDAGPVGWALSVLGAIAARDGRLDVAEGLLLEALELSRPMGYWAVVVASLAQLGSLAQQQGDLIGARAHGRACIATARQVGDLGLMAAAVTFFADLELQSGHDVAGIRLLAAESAWRTTPNPHRFVSFWSWPKPEAGAAQSRLGERAFARAWAAGERMSLDEAILDALDASPRTPRLARRDTIDLRPSGRREASTRT